MPSVYSICIFFLLCSFRLYSYTYFQTVILDIGAQFSRRHGSSLDIEHYPTPDERVWVIRLIPIPECFPACDGWDGSIGSSDLVISLVLILHLSRLISLALFSLLVKADGRKEGREEGQRRIKEGDIPRQNVYHRKSPRCNLGTTLKERIQGIQRVG